MIKKILLCILSFYSGLFSVAFFFCVFLYDMPIASRLICFLLACLMAWCSVFFFQKQKASGRSLSKKSITNREQVDTERTAPPSSSIPVVQDPAPTFEVRFQHIDTEADYPSAEGSPLNYLDAEALRFWSNKRTDFVIPAYYSETAFGRNVGPALDRLLSDGYLSLGNMEQRISLKTVPELKAILADRELKISGRKKELVNRILNHFDPETLESLFPVNIYCITDKGFSALEPYSIVLASDSHSLGLSYYRLIQAKKDNPDKDNNVILTQLLSEDIQRCYQDGSRSNFQVVINTTARFMREIGESQASFECYALSFFMWTRDLEQLDISHPTPSGYYMAKNLEEAGVLCGYDMNHLIVAFREVLTQNNPFSLATPENIDCALRVFKESLGTK